MKKYMGWIAAAASGVAILAILDAHMARQSEEYFKAEYNSALDRMRLYKRLYEAGQDGKALSAEDKKEAEEAEFMDDLIKWPTPAASNTPRK